MPSEPTEEEVREVARAIHAMGFNIPTFPDSKPLPIKLSQSFCEKLARAAIAVRDRQLGAVEVPVLNATKEK